MGSKSQSKNKTQTTTSTQNTSQVQNTAVSGDTEAGAAAVSGNENWVSNANYEDADLARKIEGDVESGAFALTGSNSGSVTVTSGRAFDIVESVALSALNGVQDVSKYALNETVEGLTHLNAGEAKNDEHQKLITVGVYVAGGVAAVAVLAKAFGGKAA